jgi:hypothetical protein
VKILGSRNTALSADQKYPIVCQSVGSWPPAVISWWKNGVRLNGTDEVVSLSNIFLAKFKQSNNF